MIPFTLERTPQPAPVDAMGKIVAASRRMRLHVVREDRLPFGTTALALSRNMWEGLASQCERLVSPNATPTTLLGFSLCVNELLPPNTLACFDGTGKLLGICKFEREEPTQ